jgi:hypothetical protein
LAEGEDQSRWAELGHTAMAYDDALVGLAANHGMSPYHDADPSVRSVSFKRAALAQAREDLSKLGDDESLWRAAIDAGVAVKNLASAYAQTTASLGAFFGVETKDDEPYVAEYARRH